MGGVNKIELYDKLCGELWSRVCDEDLKEPMIEALWFCGEEIIDDMNERLLLILLNEDESCRYVRTLLRRERRGERCVPDYLWVGVGKWMTDMAQKLTGEAEYLEHGPTRHEAMLEQERAKLLDRARNLRECAKRRCMIYKCNQITNKLDDCSTFGYLNESGFIRLYFGRKDPTDSQFAAALRDLAGKLLEYATKFMAID